MAISRDNSRKAKKKQRRARECEGENIAKPLISFLNPRVDFRLERTHRGTVKRDFVIHDPASNLHEIVRGLEQLQKMAREINLSSLPHEHQHARRRAKKLAGIISIRISKYATRDAIRTNELELFGIGQRGSGQGFEVRRSWAGKDFFRWEEQPVEQTTFSLIETAAFLALKELGKRGLLSKLRLCVSCGAWLWAKQMNQECCSDRCRKAKSRSQEANERRKKYAEYWRDYGK
jgi:hypothetical protein